MKIGITVYWVWQYISGTRSVKSGIVLNSDDSKVVILMSGEDRVIIRDINAISIEYPKVHTWERYNIPTEFKNIVCHC